MLRIISFFHKWKTSLLIGSALLLLGLLAYFLLPVLSSLGTPDLQEDMVIISVSGEEKLRVPLSQPQRVTLSQDNGVQNVVVITEDGAYMESSTCHNQICVHSGKVTRENWDFRPDGAFIICLPNQVSVELVVNSLE